MICFVSKINIVVSKKLPKMPNVSNVIQKNVSETKKYEHILGVDFLKRFHKHLSSKKIEFSGNFLMCQAAQLM